jgi:SAM-dependent methyltransferase
MMSETKFVPTHNGYGWTSTIPNQITVALLEWLSELDQSALLILDIGAGFGVATVPLLETGVRVIALDLEQSHLASIRQETERKSISNRLTTVRAQFPGSLHFENLDAIHCSNVLHFIPGSDIEIGAAKMYEWLKPGGKIFLQVGTIYAGHIKRLLPIFEERRRVGVLWAGETHEAKEYVAPDVCEATQPFMNYLDELPLSLTFTQKGFRIERDWYYTRTGLPDILRCDGRENYGMILMRPF